jgi:type IV pilus assembly protein PilY1
LADYKGALLYVTDLESKLWKINLTDQGTLFDLTQIFDGEGSNSNARLSFFAPALSIDSSGDLWAYFGTGDQQRLQQIDPSISNRIFGIRDSNFPKFSSVSSKTAGALKDTTATGSACPTDAYLGWFNKLKTNEKVTGKIAVSNETVFVSRYIPNNLSLCSPGKGSLSEHDFVCGGIYSGGSHELGAGIPTGAVIYKNRIYVGSSSMSSDGLAAGWKKTDNIAVGTSVKSTAGKGTVKIESWRERF